MDKARVNSGFALLDSVRCEWSALQGSFYLRSSNKHHCGRCYFHYESSTIHESPRLVIEFGKSSLELYADSCTSATKIDSVTKPEQNLFTSRMEWLYSVTGAG
jgi:hypothetical protein